jgi:nicotinamide-nucleotide amidase
MVSGHVLPDLARLCPSATPRVSVAVRTCGMWESEVAEAVAEVERRARSLGEPEVAFLASGGQTRVVLTGGSLEALQPWVQEVTGLLGDAVLLVDESVGVDPVALPAQVVALLLERGHSVAVAESVTAGLVTAALADVAGVSAVLRGGVTAYTPQIKGFVLHVGSLDQVVSQATATEMAQGVRALMDSDWAVATTGVAGPGPSNGVEAGTVHLAVAGPQGLLAHRELALPGDRGRVRLLATTAALDLLRRCLASAGLGNRAAGPVVVANRHPPPGRGLS